MKKQLNKHTQLIWEKLEDESYFQLKSILAEHLWLKLTTPSYEKLRHQLIGKIKKEFKNYEET